MSPTLLLLCTALSARSKLRPYTIVVRYSNALDTAHVMQAKWFKRVENQTVETLSYVGHRQLCTAIS